MNKFSFTVEKDNKGYRVYLPHSCDEWDIVGDDPYSYEEEFEKSKERAILRIEKFISKAQNALKKFKNLP